VNSSFPKDSVSVLELWAALGRELQLAPHKPVADWDAVDEMAKAAGPRLKFEAVRLRRLVKQSNKVLKPLAEPLVTDFGLPGFLAESHEPVYSDWLGWIVKQLRNAKDVFNLFGIDDPEATAACSGSEAKIEKMDVVVEHEHYIPFDDDHSGRLDLFICYPKKAAIVVEVKVSSADDPGANIKKQQRYWRWLQSRRVREQCKHAVLLATEAKRENYHDFRPVLWRDLCIRLRGIARSWLQPSRLEAQAPGTVVAALVLAFVGAVEQNLLHLPVNMVKRVAEGQNPRMSSYVPDYLDMFIGGQSR